jgi:hypothetical protein
LVALQVNPTPGHAIGDTIPDIGAYDQTGTFRALRSYAGRYVILDLSAMWCEPSKVSAQAIMKIYNAWVGNPSIQVEYLQAIVQNLSGGPSTQANATSWANFYHITRPVLHDSGNANAPINQFCNSGFAGFPEFLFLDPNGLIFAENLGLLSPEDICQVIADRARVPNPLRLPQIVSAQMAITIGSSTNRSASSGVPGSLTFAAFTGPLSVNYGQMSTSAFSTADSAYESASVYFLTASLLDPSQPVTIALQTMTWPDSVPRMFVARDSSGAGPFMSFLWDTGGQVAAAPGGLIPWSIHGGNLTLGPFTPSSVATPPPTIEGYLVTRFELARYMGAVLLAPFDPPAPDRVALDPPTPNPARHLVTLRFVIRRGGPVRLAVYDLLGRLVAQPIRGDMLSGPHTVTLDLGPGKGFSTGIYFARLETDGASLSRRFVVVR